MAGVLFGAGSIPDAYSYDLGLVSTSCGTTPYDTRPLPDELFDLKALWDLPPAPREATHEWGVFVPSQATVCAQVARDIHSEWFDRLLWLPSRIDAGVISGSTFRYVEFINNYRSLINIPTGDQSYDGNLAGEVSLSGLGTTPLNPMQAIIPTLTFTALGQSLLEGNLEVLFEDNLFGPVDAPLLPITAIRVISFPYRPEVGKFVETMEFLTEVLSKRDGTEQRIQMRDGPRQIFDVSMILDAGAERNAFYRLLRTGQGNLFGIPMFDQSKKLTAPLEVDDTSVYFDTSNADFRATELILVLGPTGQEMLTVDELFSDHVTIKGAVQVAQPNIAFVEVVPVRSGYGQNPMSWSRYTSGVISTELKFTIRDNLNLANTTTLDTYFPKLNNKYIMHLPNMVNNDTLGEGSQLDTDVWDTSINIVAAPIWSIAKATSALQVQGGTAQQSWLIRMFFHYLGGRQKTFYLPTGRDDFVITQDITNNSGFIHVEDHGFVTTYGATPTEPYRCIQITRANGTKSRHTITNAEAIGGEEILTVTPVISPALAAADVGMVEFMNLVRLRQDTVTVTPLGMGQTKFETEVIGVPA